ncbi:bifunctional DNA primase/polymerase [Streptomyces sp. NRRL F-5727]|uniref:bifunctional DNA primase/polymerase n=1 Tax=Streptomyces sp. NRRL F-5727 TaxID=1463871 RepID=UPI0004C8C9E6|nr:bifunctional DNA primase/polymerase [Streptomyces sp. NRRL F-5727]
MNSLPTTALGLAEHGLPVLPLLADKRPFGLCRACEGLACGGRPNMKIPGPCACPWPCHGWAAATTDRHTLTSPQWAAAWRRARAIGYHPGGAGVTVVDLDNAHAVTWARTALPPTTTVQTTRGEHWIYSGAMRSANKVRPGVDIKSLMAYARWLGPGIGPITVLPPSVLALVEREESTPARAAVDSSAPTRWDRSVATGCRHTPAFVQTGLERGLDSIRAHPEQGAGTAAYGAARFLAARHTACPGPCGLDGIAEDLMAAAIAVGVPAPYARRCVTNGMNAALGAAA